jgi:S-DNA-T family DNA segregation ATPase FtsK/SpoIIIE
MKIKLTLQRPAGPVDLAVTVDSATTVGDLAGYLAAAEPGRGGTQAVAGALTLGLSGAQQIALDPRQPVVDSGLRSGGTVTISRSGTSYADPQRPAAAVVRVVDGLDAGHEFSIARGGSVIGRERGCEVRLSDAMVSRRHARINVTDVVEIIDLGSANGVQIDDAAVPRAILRPADIVQIGDSRLSVRLTQATGGDSVTTGPAIAFVRSPRLDPVYEGLAFEAPEPPERPGGHRFPVIPMLAPLLMGALLYFITKSVTSIVFVALSPMMMIGNLLESRFAGKAAYKRAVADFREDTDALVEEVTEANRIEVAGRLAEHPSSDECLDAVRAGSPLLWTRRPGERGFGDIRLGCGTLPARNAIELPKLKRATRALHRELVEKVAPLAKVDGVPVVARFGESALGIGAPRSHAIPVARAVITQIAALHSPAELVLTAIVSTHSAPEWDWLKWLPHTSSPSSPLAARHLTSSQTAGTSLVSELEELLQQRAESGSDAPALPALVVLVEEDAPVEHSRLVQLAETGHAHGVHVLWVASDVTRLPAACKTYVEIGRDGGSGTAGFVHTATAVTPLQLEAVGADAATAAAHLLAPVVDVGARLDDASDLPRAVSLLNINGVELASSAEAVLERWSESRSILTGPFAPASPPKHAGSLRAVIGQSASEVHALDLRADGPHALVGGTTGAGKSELLQAWILAMAAAHSPQRLTFLLVDYKGGSAFRDCVDLPHTVGLVTDLSPHLVRRALTSLSAELRYREHVLAKHAAKDLVTLEKQGVADAPPSLVIVVDEFAALVNEVPEFVDGVVNVAQRGRSLGLHLILATQRPAGVIKDNLRANTNLRLALRMADEDDSADVLGSPEAAFFDPALPGRAVSKTGPGRLVPFQTGYAGGWTSDEPPAPDILVEELTFGAGAVWELPESDDLVPVDPGPTDIRRLVGSVRAANELAEIALPRKPWLPELKAVYDLADQSDVPTRRSDAELVFGVRDDPDNQAQPTVAFYPDREGNLAVYGTGGSGKSTLLRTLAIAAGFTVRGGPCHVYGIDFGARGLAMLEELPHVGSVISGSDHERITRLLSWLRGLIDERALRYSRINAATITDFRRLAQEADEPRILLLVDGIAAFRQAYETSDRQRWFDLFTSIVADGRPVGVHVVLSSDQRAGMTTALASAVQRRVVLRLATADDYAMLGAPADVLGPTSPPGRGVLAEDEIQVAVLGGDVDVTAQARAVHGFAEAMTRSGARSAPAIRRLTEFVAFDDLPTELDGLPVLGLAGETLAATTFDPRGGFIVSGPPGSGRTSTLRAVAYALRRWRPDTRFVFFGARRSALSDDQIWSATAIGATEVASAAASLVAELPTRLGERAGGVAVFVEGVSDFSTGAADGPLVELLKLCSAEGLPFVVEGETAGLAGGIGLVGQIKASRAGIALQPETSDGAAVYRTNFPPRTNRAEFPAGRGLLVALGKTRVVQVAQVGTAVTEGGG